jgi:NADH-quinone oxidoreductase subunit G
MNPVLTGGAMLPEASALARACANIAIVSGHVGKPNNGLLPLWPHANTQGTHDLIGDLHFGAESVPEVLYIVGSDPVGEGHMPRRSPTSPFLIVQELFMTETAGGADVVLPALSFAERDGSYTSGDRRVQRFYRALPPLSDGKADWEIAQDIAWRLGLKWDYQTAEEIFAEIASTQPRYAGLSYASLAQTMEQWPPVGDDDLYFGGTAYDNRGGVGAQTKSGVELDGMLSMTWIDAPAPPDGLIAVPSRRLYDRGTLINQSKVFDPRLTDGVVELHADDASHLGVADGDPVVVSIDGQAAPLKAHVSRRTPRGTARVPAHLPAGAVQIRKGS